MPSLTLLYQSINELPQIQMLLSKRIIYILVILIFDKAFRGSFFFKFLYVGILFSKSLIFVRKKGLFLLSTDFKLTFKNLYYFLKFYYVLKITKIFILVKI